MWEIAFKLVICYVHRSIPVVAKDATFDVNVFATVKFYTTITILNLTVTNRYREIVAR